jgi:hypothetical protein
MTDKLINISYTENLESVQMKLVMKHNLDFRNHHFWKIILLLLLQTFSLTSQYQVSQKRMY